MVSNIAVTGPSSVCAVELADVSLAVAVSRLVLEVAETAGSSAESERSFLLGDRTSLGVKRFRLSF